MLFEQIPQDDASMRHNSSLCEQMQTAVSPEVVGLATHGAASDDKAGSMATPRHWMKGNFKFDTSYIMQTLR